MDQQLVSISDVSELLGGKAEEDHLEVEHEVLNEDVVLEGDEGEEDVTVIALPINDGMLGLENIRFFCWMNSILQVLLHLPLFSNGLAAPYYEEVTKRNKSLPDSYYSQFISNMLAWQNSKLSEIRYGCVVHFFSFLSKYWHQPNVQTLETKDIREYLAQVYFEDTRYDQNDANEFLVNMLSDIGEFTGTLPLSKWSEDDRTLFLSEIESLEDKEEQAWRRAFRSSDRSSIGEKYSFVIRVRNICDECKSVSDNYEVHTTLNLPIPGDENDTKTLNDCLARFQENVKLNRPDTLYFCSTCGGPRTAVQYTTLHRAPQYLFVSLKRFQQQSNGSLTRNNSKINYPERWIGMFGGTEEYQLTSVVCHVTIGKSLQTGHYFSYCLHHGWWYRYDDKSVSKCYNGDDFSTRKTTDEPFRQNESCYILVYQRLTPEDELAPLHQGYQADGAYPKPELVLGRQPHSTRGSIPAHLWDRWRASPSSTGSLTLVEPASKRPQFLTGTTLEQGTSPPAPVEVGRDFFQEFIQSIFTNNFTRFSQLLRAKPSLVFEHDAYGRTAMMYACIVKNERMQGVLDFLGSNLAHTDKEGKTAAEYFRVDHNNYAIRLQLATHPSADVRPHWFEDS